MMPRNDQEATQVFASFVNTAVLFADAVHVRESQPERSRYMRPLAEYARDLRDAGELLQPYLNSTPVERVAR